MTILWDALQAHTQGETGVEGGRGVRRYVVGMLNEFSIILTEER